ncbi:popeye domain-containing protein 2 isoform X1 [Trichechus manatus latirostris]|uniref:Popeye domain-containing protein 2 isoform X1 n=1 Tax=Trichechus manatus latirostris TaxID=127582 RepID=A0A2Y9DFH4_TRIMA|nr:popeye domain-containing protein 2 isoform X1 [Trichechus manatus latirostris]
MSANSSTVSQLPWQGPVCVGWRQDLEGALYHLANCILLLGFMGGSGVYGCFYLFGFLGTGYSCCVLWGWFNACSLDIILWSSLLAVACLLQLVHLVYRLRDDTLPKEFDLLYKTLYLPLQVPLQTYKEIVHCCQQQVLALATEQTYAVEGETPINCLSLLLAGRVRVSQDGQFLHYVFPYQFMDSPEWESLQPSEEGVFQVTLTAETTCSYISWPRKSLHVLLAKDRYISRLFSTLLGYDISEKLYALNDKFFAKFGLRFDIRLPSLYHVLGPAAPDAGPESKKNDEEVCEPAMSSPQALPTSAQKTPPCPPPPAATNPPVPPSQVRMSRPNSGILGEDSTSLVLEDFEEVSGSESFMDYRSDGEYMR